MPEGSIPAKRTAAQWGHLISSLLADRIHYLVVLAYVGFAIVTAAIFNRHYLLYFIEETIGVWGGIALVLLLVISIGTVVWELRTRPQRPLPQALRALGRIWTAHRLARLASFLAVCAFMGAFTTIKTMLPLMQPFWADRLLGNVDRFLHDGQDPWRWLQPILGRPEITRFIELCYGPVWMLTLVIVVAWTCLFGRDHLRSRFLLAFLLSWIINGTLMAGVFMSGGPVYQNHFGGDPGRFADQLTYLAGVSSGPFSVVALQHMLWVAYLAGNATVGAGISAFPSMHVTVVTLLALQGWRLHSALGWALTGLAAVILVGSVHLGWHYAIDGYCAIAFTLVIWMASKWIIDRANQPGPRLARNDSANRLGASVSDA